MSIYRNVEVWDSVMGSGKTSLAVQMMNDNPTKKFLFVTPFLDEVQRIVDSCPSLNVKQPTVGYPNMTKRSHLRELIEKGENIASTHALFISVSPELGKAISTAGYTLILDEVVNVLEPYKMYPEQTGKGRDPKNNTTDDVRALLRLGVVDVGSESKLCWKENGISLGRYDDIKRLTNHEMLYFINDSALMWSFPINVFLKNTFEEVYVLTYQFSYQTMSPYFDFFGIKSNKFFVEKDAEGRYFKSSFKDQVPDDEFRKKLKSLIHISSSEKANQIGLPDNYKHGWGKLSFNWWERYGDTHAEEVSRNVVNYFKHGFSSKLDERAWTCFTDSSHLIKGEGIVPRNWVAFNARATNKYRHKNSLAYLVNRYFNPSVVKFFALKDIALDEDGWALSEMLQWIFRSSVRDGKEIGIYLPSLRMRRLLEAYLNNDSLENIYDVELSRRKRMV